MSKELVYQDKDFEFYLEAHDSGMFIHLDVWKYGKSVLVRLINAFEDIKDACAMEGVETLYAFSPNHKFCTMGGGELLNIQEYRGEEYGVYKWEMM